jgi:acyl carrier protein
MMALTQGKLMGFLHETLNIGEADSESELFSSGLLDSVSMVNLLTFVEQSTGIAIRAEDVTLENFDTPSRILRFAEAYA